MSKINLSRGTFYPIMVVSIFISRTKRDKKDLSKVFGLSILSLPRRRLLEAHEVQADHISFILLQPLSKIRKGLETKRDMTVRTFDYLYRNQQRGKGNPKNPPTVSAQFQVCPLLCAIFI